MNISDDKEAMDAIDYLLRNGYTYSDIKYMWEKKDRDSNEVVAKDVMIRLPGRERSFYCSCGCNIFRKLKRDRSKYICNACKTSYTTE